MANSLSAVKAGAIRVLSTKNGMSRTVLICDKNPVLADGIRHILLEDDHLSKFIVIADVELNLAQIKAHPPFILMLDPWQHSVDQNVTNGMYQRLSKETSLIGYCPEITKSEAQSLQLLGFRAVIPKSVQSDELVRVFCAVAFGGFYFHDRYTIDHNPFPANMDHQATMAPGLTERETEVLRQVALGSSIKEIAVLLKISTKTVDTYKTRANRKLNLNSRSDIVQYAIQSGWMH